MQFIIIREHLLKSLQQVSHPLYGRPLKPILGNILIQVNKGTLRLTSTNLEIEVTATISLSMSHISGETTVSARKFFNICRGLPQGAEILIQLKENYILIKSEKIRFLLMTLPVADFPNLDSWKSEIELHLPKIIMKKLIELTYFSMANQDVRYYLNGILFETEGKEIHTVATDGHRLAYCAMSTEVSLPNHSIIIPRKGTIELIRMLSNSRSDSLLHIQISNSNIRVHFDNFIFTSKLIEGQFPNYRKVMLQKLDKALEVNRGALKRALARITVLSNEKLCGVRFYINKSELRIVANNSQKEEAEEILDIIYDDNIMEISINANYILEAINSLKCEDIRILFTDPFSRIQIENSKCGNVKYIIMPMRL